MGQKLKNNAMKNETFFKSFFFTQANYVVAVSLSPKKNALFQKISHFCVLHNHDIPLPQVMEEIMSSRLDQIKTRNIYGLLKEPETLKNEPFQFREAASV